MAEFIHEPVYIGTDKTEKAIVPAVMDWRGRTYQFVQLGLHHTTFDGDTLIHIFSMVTTQASFQILLNTKTLLWTLENVEAL